jgi:hypothetical protein
LSYRIKEDEWMAHGTGTMKVRNACKILVLQSEINHLGHLYDGKLLKRILK